MGPCCSSLLKRRAALACLRRLRDPTAEQFIIATGYLFGGLAEYYLQTLYVPFEELDAIEGYGYG